MQVFNTDCESVLSVLVKIECEQMQGRAGDCDCEGKKASFSTQVAAHPIFFSHLQENDPQRFAPSLIYICVSNVRV